MLFTAFKVDILPPAIMVRVQAGAATTSEYIPYAIFSKAYFNDIKCLKAEILNEKIQFNI